MIDVWMYMILSTLIMQVYNIIVFIASLTIHIVLVTSHSQNLKDNMMKKEVDALENILKLTATLKTTYSIKYGVHRDIQEKKTINQDFTSDLERKRFLLYDKINSRIEDLQCTYAQYAQKHFTLLWSVVDHYLLYENISTIVYNLQSMYVEVAKKTMVTLYNKKYEPSKWMYDLLTFLQMETIDVTTYKKQLSGMLATLMAYTSIQSCKLNDIPKIKYNILESNYLFSRNFLNIIQIKNMNREISAKTWFIDKKVKNTFTHAYLKGPNNPNDNPAKKYVNIPVSVRVCDTFLFHRFQYITDRVIDNLFAIHYILYMNQKIFRYDNYETFFIQEEKILEKVPITKYNDESVNNESDFYIEFSEVNTLHGKVKEILNNAVWRSDKTKEYIRKIKIKDVKEKKNDENFDYKKYYRSEYALLINIMNSLMYDLQCTYAYYAREHLNGVKLLLKDEFSANGNTCDQDDVFIVTNYFEVSLKTLATVYSSGYQAPEWMLRLVLYLSKISELFNDLNKFKTENDKLLIVLNDVMTSCKIADDPPIVLKLTKENIETTTEMQPIYTLKYYYEFTDTHIKYVIEMYNNLMRIKYFLNINKNVLIYTDYEKFNPSKWVFKLTSLTAEKIKNLRWDNNIRLGKDDRWDISAALISSNFNYRVESTDEFRNSTLIYTRIIDFARVAIIRYVIFLGGFCNSITYGYSNFNEAVFNDSNPGFSNEYTHYCSNIKNSIGDLLEWSGLNMDRVFIELMDALVVVYFHHDIFQTKGFRFAVKKLNQFSINLDINAHVSLIYRWVLYTSRIEHLISINKSILNVLLAIVKDVNNSIVKYIKILKNDYEDINFNIFRLVSKSFGNKRIYKRYVESIHILQ